MVRVAGSRRSPRKVPAEPDVLPVEPDVVPVEPDVAPAAPQGLPAAPQGLPAAPQGMPAAPPAEPDLLVVGRIGRPQGIRGEVTVQVRTDDPGARFAVGSVLLTDPPDRGPLTVASARDQNGRLILGFAGVADRNAAELLRETLLQVDAATLPPPEDEDEFHDHVLRGMDVRLLDGTPLGEVADVLHLPHGDVLVVRRADNGAEVLVPFVRAMVPEVDVAARMLLLDPPEGLLDLTDPATSAGE